MQMKEVKSSSISHVGHDPATNQLTVRFTNGGTYIYDGVTTEDHKALMESESIGKHFGQHIRPKFAGKRVATEFPQPVPVAS